MKNSVKLAAIAAILLCDVGFAQTAAQYVSRFGTLFNGKYAKIVWSRGSTIKSAYNEDYFKANVNFTIWCMDTKDGVERQLSTSNTAGAGHHDMASFTYDGSRVVFYNKQSNTVYVINWDGTGIKTVALNAWSSSTWRDADGKDWAVCNNPQRTKIWRVMVDDTTQKVALYNVSGGVLSIGLGPVNMYGCVAALSNDGAYMAENYAVGYSEGQDNRVGRRSTSSASTPFTQVGSGCWPQMLKSNSYTLMYTPDEHDVIIFVGMNGSSRNVAISDPLLGGEMYNCNRRTNDTNFVSFATVNGGITGPYICRLSPISMVTMFENATQQNLVADVFIYSGSTDARSMSVIEPRASSAPWRIVSAQSIAEDPAGVFSVMGRSGAGILAGTRNALLLSQKTRYGLARNGN